VRCLGGDLHGDRPAKGVADEMDRARDLAGVEEVLDEAREGRE